jgi:hypothetical protein
MPTTLAAVLLFVLLAAAPTDAAVPEASGNAGVRPLTRGAAALLEDGARRSPLMRSQLALLGASDLVVYLTEAFEVEAGEPKGRLQFVSAAAGRRYVIVCLARWKMSWNDRLVLLAHELQHAVEVADAPEVADVSSFRDLYTRIGWQLRPGHFETEAARQATVRMRLDLQLARPAHAAPAEEHAFEAR